MPKEGQIVIEDAQLLYRNFAGKPGPYNIEGNRNFCVFLPEDVAEQMAADGYNIKLTNPREEGDEPKPYVQVRVNFGSRPPRIVMLTERARTTVTEDMVSVLDYADIASADMVLNPHVWGDEIKGGLKPYLKSLFVKIDEDPLEKKYAVNDGGEG